MKFWLLPCILLLATSCSHGSASTGSASSGTKAEAKSDTKADTKAATAPATTKKMKAKVSAAAAGDGSGAAGERVERTNCKSGGDERLVEIVSKGGGCAVEYTKQSQKQEIATAEHETEHCKQVLQKVRGKLEAAGFSCN